MAEHLLARFAENMFWLARYMERAENLARILDVNEFFTRDHQDQHNWLPVLQMNSDHKCFLAHKLSEKRKPTAATVIAFYIIDKENPTSIIFAVRAARENAHTIQYLISTEMCTQLNVFYNWLNRLNRRDVSVRRLSEVCAAIKTACQTHAGITEGTLYRDEARWFYDIGRHMERANQTSRLLDIKYRQLQEYDEADGSPVDDSQWNALLRSVARYQAFRRAHPQSTDPKSVAAFLVFQEKFPRSIARSVNEIRSAFRTLERRHRLPRTPALNGHRSN